MAYHDDKSTKLILETLQSGKLLRDIVPSVESRYRTAISNDRLQLVDDKVEHLHPIDTTVKFVMWNVPLSLRLGIFSNFHASPCVDRLDEYKTFYRIQCRFFCLECVKICKRGSKRMFIVYITSCGDDGVRSWYFLGWLSLPFVSSIHIYEFPVKLVIRMGVAMC